MGCSVRQVLCSICGQELDHCGHKKGQQYDGKLCHGVLTGAADAYEWSFVAVPAQRQAGVVKSKRYGGQEPPPEEPQKRAKVIQAAKARLALEKIRYGGM